MASPKKKPKKSGDEPTKVTITYLANVEHWERQLPKEHGQ